MNKQDVKKIVDDEISKFVKDSLDKEVKKMIAKSNSPSRAEIISMIKNGLEAVYKVLWQKRDFWKTDIR
jgi:ATP-dependent Lon protease